jgi:hypothetical protein
MPNNIFNFPMYMKEQGQQGAYGSPLSGLMDAPADSQQASQKTKSPFQLLGTRFTPLQKGQQEQRDEENLQGMEMPEIEGVPQLNAVRKRNEVRT